MITLKTSLGDIKIELDFENAPVTAKNFQQYVEEGHYNGTIFHRVIKGFMIQGGGFGLDNMKKQTRSPVKNESNNGLNNDTGTIAMARTNNVDSAMSQFYINVNNNKSLNASFGKLGYAVFGKVTKGMDIVMKIAEVETKPAAALGNDAPIVQVVINSITLVDQKKTDAIKN